jgi:hypothetical protein
MHISLHVLSTDGMLPSKTVGAPGDHGAAVAGMQGMGVSTPKAAEVAAATVGFAKLRHIPKGNMFTMGLLSMMFAAGWLLDMTRFIGSTTNALGAKPCEHINCAPLTTCIGINQSLMEE